MHPNPIIATLETGAVTADLRLASTRRALQRRLERNEILTHVRRAITADPEETVLLLERAVQLYEAPGPAGYAHPDDLLLAAYLYVLARAANSGVRFLVFRVARERRPEFYAATGVAQGLLEVLPMTTEVPVAAPAIYGRPEERVYA